MKTLCKWLKTGAIVTAAALSSLAQGAPAKPNIILLFADDAGYADFGFHGSTTMPTPHLDRLAREGVRFTQAYVSDPTCGPSRAGLITGRYQQRFGYEENNVPGFMSPVSALDWGEMGLPLAEVTMADYLKRQGYGTGILGKWHLGSADRYHPLRRGFDEFLGFRGGDRSYYTYAEDDPERQRQAFFDKHLERGFGEVVTHEGYLTDVLGAEASDFIRRHREQPFFLFLSFNAVHTPIEAKPEDLAQFPHLSGLRRELAAMTLAMDRAIGQVMQTLEQEGLADNTLVVFTNDNGGPTDKNGSSNYPLSGTKSNHLEGGIRVPMVMRWPAQLPAGAEYRQAVSTLDLLPTFYAAAGGETYDNPVDGVNLLPYLQGRASGQPHERLYWRKETRAAMREGDWKLLRYPDRPAELYNLARDQAEQHNLAAREPERLARMFKTLFEWELTLERPLWLLKREYDKYDLDRMDRYRVPAQPPELINP